MGEKKLNQKSPEKLCVFAKLGKISSKKELLLYFEKKAIFLLVFFFFVRIKPIWSMLMAISIFDPEKKVQL